MARVCEACGKKIGYFAEWQSTRTGCVCEPCADRLRDYRNDMLSFGAAEIAEAMELIRRNYESVAAFTDSHHIGNKLGYVALFDDGARCVLLPKRIAPVFADQGVWCFPYDDIVSARLLTDKQPAETDALGKVLVGGALFGGIGAIAGIAAAQDAGARRVSDSIEVEVAVRGYWSDTYTVRVLAGGLRPDDPRNDEFLRHAVELTDRLNEIAGNTGLPETAPEQPAGAPAPVDATDEIRKFKALADDGIITPEEFETKKRQLLGL